MSAQWHTPPSHCRVGYYCSRVPCLTRDMKAQTSLVGSFSQVKGWMFALAGGQEPALPGGPEAPSNSGRRRRRATRAHPQERQHSAAAGGTRDRVRPDRTLTMRCLRRLASGIVTRMGGEAARSRGLESRPVRLRARSA